MFVPALREQSFSPSQPNILSKNENIYKSTGPLDANKLRQWRIFQVDLAIAKHEEAELREQLRYNTAMNLGYNYRKSSTLFRADRKELFIGVSSEIPFEQTRQRARLNEKQIQIKTTELEQKAKIDERLNLVTLTRQKIDHLQQKMQDNLKGIKLSEQIIKEQTSRYNQGLLSFQELTTSKNLLESLKLNTISDSIELQKQLITWFKATDSLSTLEF